MRKALPFILLAFLALTACQELEMPQENNTACTMDAKQCPDGSYVGRVPPDCNFEACPRETAENNSVQCDYPDNAYLSRDAEECSTMKFQCVEGTEPFNNECGCGCAPIDNEEKTFCNPEQRDADFCTKEYRPVCGWFSAEVQCIREPCAETFSNPCTACSEEDVSYYTQGECPQQ